jgi:probable HAF family extracellular repeat protein
MAPYTYAFASRNGRFISFRFPGALATAAAGINDAGQVVGQYTFDYKTFHGFVTSPIASSDFQSTNCWSVPIDGTEQ